MTSTAGEYPTSARSLSAGRSGKKAAQACGIVARLGLGLGDLTDLSPSTQRRISPLLLVAEILAGAAQ